MIGKLLSFFAPGIPSPTLPDHDISNLLASATSSRWTHTYACSKCHAPIGHQEFMTDICLTCGQQMSPKSAAMRRIVRGHRWIDTIRVERTEYEHIAGRGWIPLER